MKIKITMLMLIIVLSTFSTGVVMAGPVSAADTIIVPTGSTSAQIQELINNAHPGDTISFEPGTYTDIKVKINKTLNLIGNGAVIKGINETDTNIFTIIAEGAADASGSTIKGFEFFLLNNNVTLSNGKIVSTGYGINLATVSNVAVSNVTSHDGKAAVYNGNAYNTLVENCTFDDQYLKGYAVHIMGGSNITVRNNNITGAMDGVSMASGASNIYVDNNRFLNCDFSAFWGGGITNITFINNLFDGFNEGLGVEKAANDTKIINNTFVNGKGDAIYIMNSGAHGSMTVISSIEIINNLFKDIVGAAIGVDKAGNFNADGSGHAIVGINNSLQNVTKGYVVLYSGSSGVNLTGNHSFTLDSSYPEPEPLNPILSISSTINPKVIKNGDTTTFTVTVKNLGNGNATNIKVKNILKNNFFSSSTLYSSLGTYANGIWNIGTLTAGNTAALVINAKAIKSGITSSQAIVTADNNVTAESNTINKTVNKNVKLSYANTVSSTKVAQGKYVWLTTKITNTGLDVSDPINIKMTLPSGMKLVSVSSAGYFNKKTNSWTFNCPAGKTSTFNMKAQVTSKGTKTVTFNINGTKQTKTITGI